MMLEDIADHLEANGIGTVETDIFIGLMPDAVDTCIGLYEYAGKPPTITHEGTRIERPGLQVIARGTDYSAVRATLQAIDDLIDGLSNVTIGAGFYLSILAEQSAISKGWQGLLVRIIQNYSVEMRG